MAEKKYIIETIGYIMKEEILTTLEHEIMPNTFVLETQVPFPGYHHAQPADDVKKPKSIFFVTKKKNSSEKLIRITAKIKKYFEHDFDASPSEIFINNQNLSAIRINHFTSLSYIAELQEQFADNGLNFAKKKNISAKKGIIKVIKYFMIEEKDKGYYQDVENPEMTYFALPTKLNWKLFEKITLTVKNSMQAKNFDAAIGVFYRKFGMEDMVRIFDNECSIDKLKLIRDKYVDEIKNYME